MKDMAEWKEHINHIDNLDKSLDFIIHAFNDVFVIYVFIPDRRLFTLYWEPAVPPFNYKNILFIVKYRCYNCNLVHKLYNWTLDFSCKLALSMKVKMLTATKIKTIHLFQVVVHCQHLSNQSTSMDVQNIGNKIQMWHFSENLYSFIWNIEQEHWTWSGI